MMISGAGIPQVLGHRSGLRGIEIGMAAGWTTRHFFQNLPGLRMVEIDPFLPYVDWNGDEHTVKRAAERLGEFWQNNGEWRDRIQHFHTTSDRAAEFLPDGLYDFVFIDGLHTYEQVKKDLKNYYPKIKSGGIFSGHDFNGIKEVGDAVREFAGEQEISQTHVDCWWWRKP